MGKTGLGLHSFSLPAPVLFPRGPDPTLRCTTYPILPKTIAIIQSLISAVLDVRYGGQMKRRFINLFLPLLFQV